MVSYDGKTVRRAFLEAKSDHPKRLPILRSNGVTLEQIISQSYVLFRIYQGRGHDSTEGATFQE